MPARPPLLRAQPLSGGCTPAGAVLNVVTPQDGFGPYTPEAVNKNFFEVIGTLQPDRQLQQMQCVDFGSTFGEMPERHHAFAPSPAAPVHPPSRPPPSHHVSLTILSHTFALPPLGSSTAHANPSLSRSVSPDSHSSANPHPQGNPHPHPRVTPTPTPTLPVLPPQILTSTTAWSAYRISSEAFSRLRVAALSRLRVLVCGLRALELTQDVARAELEMT